MVKVSIEVRNGATRFRVGVQATSIQGAISLVEALYFAGDLRVIFPIAPEVFFVGDAFATEGLIERGKPHEEEELAA